ncbi:hypothetical protein LCGC14_1126420 [marine sediment metagenome]|uniref:Uncharacterized protein n=1 Tax=marine sediment metagenome TaxID=412755 RepID=A0A0F9M762_9ZZZZ
MYHLKIGGLQITCDTAEEVAQLIQLCIRPKARRKKTRPNKYNKPLSLYPMKFEDVVRGLLQTKPADS